MLIDIIAGARPNFMKIASIVKALQARQAQGSTLRFRLIHTGQHYDAKMSGDFFEQLGIPHPEINLEVGSGTQSQQTGAIMQRYEQVLISSPSNCCLVVGDVNSTLACTIVAKKQNMPVAHVEAGIRSGDMTMPEEINRIVTDSITDWYFTTSELAGENLRQSGKSSSQIFFVGNTMIDTLYANLGRLSKPNFFKELNLKENEYFVTTLHRPANVDQADGLLKLIVAIGDAARGLPVVFPLHPRTASTMNKINAIPENIHIVDPQAYLQFIWLVKNAKAVITDSGGITEETTALSIPCITLRNSTERPETVELGTNVLLGTDPAALKTGLDPLFENKWKSGKVPPLWDGKTGMRIATKLEELLLNAD